MKSRKAISGLIYTGIDMIFSKGLTFLSTMFLARVLGPEEFGLIGMITIFITLGTVLVDGGFSASIIRTKNANEVDYSTVFYTNLLSSISFYLAIYFTAPFISQFFQQEILTIIIRIYCLSFIVTAFSSIQTAILVRSLEFRKIMFINVPSNIVGILVGIYLAYNQFGVWSIIFMNMITQMVYASLIWSISRWKPSLQFSVEKFKTHFNFGYKLMISGVINALFDNIYNVLIGKYYSLKLSGYYERSKALNEYPVIMLSNIINKVAYPMLSEIRDEKIKVAEIFQRLIQISFFFTAPLMLIIAGLAHPLFEFFLGVEWTPAVSFFQILCLSAILYPIHAFNINVLQVMGRSDLFLKLEIIKKILMVVVIIISIKFGIYYLLYGAVLTSYLSLVINGIYSEKTINYSLKKQIQEMFPVWIFSILVGLLTYWVVLQMADFELLFQIFSSLFIGLFAYVLLVWFFKPIAFTYFIHLVRKIKII